jgi:hypothetical protein
MLQPGIARVRLDVLGGELKNGPWTTAEVERVISDL